MKVLSLSGITAYSATLPSPRVYRSISSWSVMAWIWGRLKGASRTAADTKMLLEVLPAASLKTLYCRTATLSGFSRSMARNSRSRGET